MVLEMGIVRFKSINWYEGTIPLEAVAFGVIEFKASAKLEAV
jgi:hypothetical protein